MARQVYVRDGDGRDVPPDDADDFAGSVIS